MACDTGLGLVTVFLAELIEGEFLPGQQVHSCLNPRAPETL